MKMGTAIYEQEQASAAADAPADGGAENAADDDVVEAEFSEVDDENKG